MDPNMPERLRYNNNIIAFSTAGFRKKSSIASTGKYCASKIGRKV